MTTGTTLRTASLSIALGLIFVPVLSGPSQAQRVDLNAAAKAKAQAGREALSLPPADPPGPKTVGTFITFDAPGAGTGGGQGTFPASINQSGDVTGYYLDANFLQHGFLLAKNGAFTTFDAPGAALVFNTSPSSINPAAAITGSYFDDVAFLPDGSVQCLQRGFLRASTGTITPFDAPGADTNPVNCGINGTVGVAINPEGAITGNYLGEVAILPNGSGECVAHGFLRASDGTITAFDAPGADTNPLNCGFNGTAGVGINPEGIILGVYTDTNGLRHGYLRAAEGSFTTFDPPGNIAIFAPFSFGPDLYMNPTGVVTGTYFQPISGNPFGGNFRVFVRSTDDTFTTFDAVMYPNGNPNLNIPCCTWSFPSGIGPSGTITGSFNDGFTRNHGFLRDPNGTLTMLDVPGAGSGFNQGTAPLGIIPSGVVMGLYIDANDVTHGFFFLPSPSS
jgi:hypothetical protein